MKKVIINENQKGLLFKDGRFITVLNAGKYNLMGGKSIELLDIDKAIVSSFCTLDKLLQNSTFSSMVTVADVNDEQLALHYVDGRFSDVLTSGRYAYWKTENRHEFKMTDFSVPTVADDIPEFIFSKIPFKLYYKFNISNYEKGCLFFDDKLEGVLESGVYYFWRNKTDVKVLTFDTRLTQMDITGQEILTADKVSLRINFVCTYKITDIVKSLNEVNDFERQMHVAAQLAMREYVGKYKLDEILENKEQLSQFVFERLKEKCKEIYVEITEAGVKDIILPGEIRDIMNTVLMAEKQAQANVITRREEVASTRSLLNTARLMDENKTLYKLKELEYVEKICENVGNITLNGSGDVLSQLGSILSKKDN